MELFELRNFARYRPAKNAAAGSIGVSDIRSVERSRGKSNARSLSDVVRGAQHPDIEWLIGPERILDPTRYFVIIVNMFGNGLSTSPCNLGDAWQDQPWPVFTHIDNVTAQRRMLAEILGIERLALAYGWSMGGQQALHWGALFPEQVERIAAICTSARTSIHNRVFLEGIHATLTTDPAWNGRATLHHQAPEPRPKGLGPGLRGLGLVARLLSRAALSRGWLRVARGLPRARLGSQAFCGRVRRQPAIDDRNMEEVRYQRQRSDFTKIFLRRACIDHGTQL